MDRQNRPKTLRTDAAAMVAGCAGNNSRLAARLITHLLDHELAATGLSVAQLGLLAHVAATSDDTLSALAQRTGHEQSTLSRNLRTLEDDGLVEIAAVEGNLRRRMVWLTEAGARRLEAAIPVWRSAQAKLARSIPPRLARQLAEAARTMTA
jgi:DNA-binding MarR family transcriptional regulator